MQSKSKICSGHCAKCPHLDECPARKTSSVSPILFDCHNIKKPSRNDEGIGFVADVGSTTLAAAIYDLQSGKLLASKGCINPQTEISADVIGRIAAAETKEGFAKLQTLVENALHKLLTQVCNTARISPSTLSDGVVTGNTAMLHILFGRSPSPLGRAPFLPQWLAGCEETLLGRKVWLPPCIGAFTGADLTCAIIAAGLDKKGPPAILCDIGTNAEVAIRINETILATSTAAGPAFEQTGIRGSELLDAIAEFLSSGKISKNGYSTPGSLVLKDGRTLQDRDVRAVQTAKAAIAAGIETMLAEAKISTDEIEELFLAGGFGCGLNPDSATAIGMLPATPNAKKIQIGNAALSGAAILLLCPEKRNSIIELSRRAKLIELGGNPNFSNKFISAMSFA
jgi:uncharacterized 2Fe-2S/4Fe-4S cluster protein (DUF4445 family)